MAGYPKTEPKLCWVGRTMQKLGCLPCVPATKTSGYHQISIHPVDSGVRYSSDIKYTPGPRFPPPQPDEPRPQTLYTPTPYTPTYQLKSPRVPKSPKKTPVAQTVPLSTLQLPVHTLPVTTPTATCVTLNVDLPPIHPTISHTPYLVPLSTIPQTPHRNAFPDSILQNLGNIEPTQYIWDTQGGTLTYTPAPASHLLLPNHLADHSPYLPRIVDTGNGNDGSMGLGLIPSPISSNSSDSSSDCSDSDHRFGITLHPLLALDLSEETSIDWNVSDPATMVRHVEGNATFLANVGQPATNPPTHTLRIDFHFIDQPGVRWNWEPITMNKRRPIRIADVIHSIHDYFQKQITHPEYDIIKSYGKRNASIVAKSFGERVASQPDAMKSVVYHAGLRRVDCLGSCKIFAGLWAEGSQLKLGLRA